MSRVLPLLAFLLVAGVQGGIPLEAAPAVANHDRASDLRFERNDGQADPGVSYLARGAAYDVYLAGTDAILVLPCDLLRIQILNGNPASAASGHGLLESRSRYIRSSSGSALFDVPHYQRVINPDIYDGVDVVYYGVDRQLEYDFVIAPGKVPEQIRVKFEGASRVSLDEAGDLHIAMSGGEELRQLRPEAYQMVDGIRRGVDVRYVIKADTTVQFEVSDYDPQNSLIIDPVLVYSTYLGGGAEDTIEDVAVDRFGYVYAIGSTRSTNFPVVAAYQAAHTGGNYDVFIAKYKRDGSSLVFATYFGSPGNDWGEAIAVNHTGIFITGHTASAQFPTTAGAFRTTRPYNFGNNIFLARFSPDGTTLRYSTYIAGAGVKDIAADAAGSAYITGETNEGVSFPVTTGAYDTSAFHRDAFVMKVHPDGAGLVYSTFIGGASNPQAERNHGERAVAIAVDKHGFAYVAGRTTSDQFPTVNAFQSTPGGGDNPLEANHDGFVTKLNQNGTALVYSSYIGGSGNDDIEAAAFDPEDDSFFVGGITGSANFPVAGTPYRTSGTGFVAKIRSNGTLAYSTRFPEQVMNLGQQDGYAYVAGSTNSTSFPVVEPHQAALAGSFDAYVAVLNGTGSTLTYSTYFGGSASDSVTALTVDTSGTAYFAGSTESSNFPTLQPVQAASGGGKDGFLSKISFDKDGDGLLDRWEVSGIDVDHDGTVDLDLAALGANKDHKDVFVEVDFMVAPNHTHHPARHPSNLGLLAVNPLQGVIDAFAAAPVDNPDQQQGITLHVLVDEAIPEMASMTFNGAASDFNTIKNAAPANPCGAAHFGRPADRSSENCVKIIKARRRVYRYALFGHEYATHPTASGVAEMPGNDFAVTLPVGVPGPGNGFDDTATTLAASFGTTFDQEFADGVAGTFMHELGHSLGLNHGGGLGQENEADAAVHRKPNYLSVMNYSFQMNAVARDAINPAVITRTNRPLDYSTGVLNLLNENGLNEAAGIGGPPGWNTLYGMGQTGLPRIAPAAGPIDWNGANGLEAAAGADVNYIVNQTPPSFGQILGGHDDWRNLVYDFRSSPDYVDGEDFQTFPDTPEIAADPFVDVHPPTCSINAPGPGTVFATVPATINILASAGAATDATLIRVEFYNGSTKLGEDDTAPYSFAWSSVAAGTYYLNLRAIDSFGLVGISDRVRVTVGPPASGQLYTVAPCRTYDSRGASVLPHDGRRDIQISGTCGVPSDAKAVFANIVGIAPTTNGFMSMFPSDVPWPGNSTLNYRVGKTRANNTIIMLSETGSVAVYNNGAAIHFIIDVSAYFK